MLWRGRNVLTFGRGTPCSVAIILPCGVGGDYKLESLGFLGRKFCIRNVEILSVGKIVILTTIYRGKEIVSSFT